MRRLEKEDEWFAATEGNDFVQRTALRKFRRRKRMFEGKGGFNIYYESVQAGVLQIVCLISLNYNLQGCNHKLFCAQFDEKQL